MESTANEQQAAYWNEEGGPRWVEYQERLDRHIETAGLAAMDEAEVAHGERVLDIGCGCGGTSLELARRVGDSGSVLGADLSGPMLGRARERAQEAGLTNVTFVQADVQTHAFEEAAFDLAFSRFGVMFFADPVAAFRNVRGALRPGGRVCFICWRPLKDNPWTLLAISAAAKHIELPKPPAPGEPGPFSLGDPDRVRAILSEAGFQQISIRTHDERHSYERTVDEALEFLQKIGPLSRVLKDVSDEKRFAVMEEVRKALEPHVGPDGVEMPRAMWIVRAENPA